MICASYVQRNMAVALPSNRSDETEANEMSGRQTIVRDLQWVARPTLTDTECGNGDCGACDREPRVLARERKLTRFVANLERSAAQCLRR